MIDGMESAIICIKVVILPGSLADRYYLLKIRFYQSKGYEFLGFVLFLSFPFLLILTTRQQGIFSPSYALKPQLLYPLGCVIAVFSAENRGFLESKS